MMLPSSAPVARTKYHRLGCVNSRHSLMVVLGADTEVRVTGGSVLGRRAEKVDLSLWSLFSFKENIVDLTELVSQAQSNTCWSLHVSFQPSPGRGWCYSRSEGFGFRF